MMTITNGYCTLRELKAHMGKTNADTANDALLENSIESASREIDYRITGRRDFVAFSETTLTASEVYYGYGLNDDCLIMNSTRTRIYTPIKFSTVTSVVDDGITLTENVDYRVGYDFIQRIGKWTSDEETGVKITGTISSDTVPDEIRNLCMNMAEVLSGMSTRVVTGSDGIETEIRLKNYPGWVNNRLKSIGMTLI